MIFQDCQLLIYITDGGWLALLFQIQLLGCVYINSQISKLNILRLDKIPSRPINVLVKVSKANSVFNNEEHRI